MCGILYSHFKHKALLPREQVFKDALALMEYRGPDHTGYKITLNEFFGHTRLSIIDVSEASHQPVSVDGKTLVFNGKLYNYKDLEPNATSDTRVLFDRLCRSNVDFNALQGMYAAVFKDDSSNSLLLLRDFFGEKPMYCFKDEDCLIISSTIKSIKHIVEACSKTLTISEASIQDYLMFGYIREPYTIYEEIDMIRSGAVLEVDLTDYSTTVKHKLRPASFTWSSYRQSIARAITSTDFDPVLLLSAGVDSGYLSALIHEQELDADMLIYKANRRGKDESQAAIDNLLTINEHASYHVVENASSYSKLLEDLAKVLEQPSDDGVQMVNIFQALKMRLPTSKVVLTGLGGDELFGGYSSYRLYPKFKMLRGLGFISKWTGITARRFLTTRIPGNDTYSFYFRYRIDAYIASIASPKDLSKAYDRFIKTLPSHSNSNNTTDLGTLKILESMDYMRNQLLRVSDNVAMAFGLENRSPLLAPAALAYSETGRKTFIDYQKQQYGIVFGEKRGFTYHRSDEYAKGTYEYQELISLASSLLPPVATRYLNLLDPDDPASAVLRKRLYLLDRWMFHSNN